MKLRHRLTIYFSIAFTLLLLGFGLSIYFFSSHYRKNEFSNNLRQRIEITRKMFLEKENFPEEVYAKIKEEFLHNLPEETDEVVEVKENFREFLKHSYPEKFLNDLQADEQTFFMQGNRQGAGKIFHLKGGNYMVIVTAVDVPGINKLRYLRTILILSHIICLVATYFLSYIISGYLLKPISEKIKKANKISASNLHERLSVYNPNDEIGELAIAFNHLLERIEKAFEAQKQFISNASHEIRTPLTAIIGQAELSLEKIRPVDDYIESMKSIAMEADRLNLMVNNLLQLSKINYNEAGVVFSEINVEELLLEAEEKFDFMRPANKVVLNFPEEAGFSLLKISGNKNLLITALVNIMDNAVKFSSEDKNVEVCGFSDFRSVTISVKDEGIGIPAQEISKITQPFYRAENARQVSGSGIGMSLTKRIVELHKGRLDINSQLNKGTEVKIILPLLFSA